MNRLVRALPPMPALPTLVLPMLVLSVLVVPMLVVPGLTAAAPDLAGFAYQQRPGTQVPLDAELHDATGRSVRFGDLLVQRPTILALGYFHCPNLCGVVRNDLFNALGGSGLAPGDYSLVALSIDPAETPADAAKAKHDDIERNGLPSGEHAWHYVTGAPEQLQAIEAAVGFRARFDPQLKQFLHPAGIVLLTQAGIVSGYLLGVGYQPGDLRTAVIRARNGGIAKAALPVLLLCFHFDPTTGRYTLAVTKLLELAAVLTALTLASTIGLALWRERRP